jgi:hypothetical protein
MPSYLQDHTNANQISFRCSNKDPIRYSNYHTNESSNVYYANGNPINHTYGEPIFTVPNKNAVNYTNSPTKPRTTNWISNYTLPNRSTNPNSRANSCTKLRSSNQVTHKKSNN